MADEAPVAETASAEVVPETAPVEAPTEPSVVPPPVDDDLEPGGASPEDVRARKEYRTRKTVERELQSERIEKIRLEERLRVLEQQQTKPPPEVKPRIYTPDEVQAAIDAGQVSHAQASAYFAKVEAERILDEREAKREAQAKAQAPLQRAESELNEYMSLLPWTKDQQSPEFKAAADIYASLVHEYGLPENIVTQRLAVERYAGPLQKIKDRMASDKATRVSRTNDAHSEAPAGGPAPGKSSDVSQAPAHMQAVWNKTGMSPEARAKEFAYWKASRK